jgi:hypothetical protein
MYRKYFRLNALLIMAALLLSGCADTIMTPRPMALVSGERAAHPALAIEGNGTKHLVWVEYRSSTSNLVYTRTHFGAPELQIQIDPPEGNIYTHPDIAVDGAGNAFLVFSQCEFITCRVKYAVIPADSSGAAPVVGDLPPGPALSNTKTSVIARENWVYAVFEVPLIIARASDQPLETGAAQGNGVYYRQLQGGSRAGKVLVDLNYQAEDASPGIDANGDLFVALKATNVSTNEASIRVYSNVGLSGDMDPKLYTSAVTGYLSSPSLAIGGDGAIYVAYASQSGAGHQVYVRELGVFNTTVPYGSITNWELLGDPQVTTIGADFYTVFSARNSASSDYEIWGLREGVTNVAQITDNQDEDGVPHVSRMTIEGSEWPVFGWRIFTDSSGSTCYGDGYLGFLSVQKIYEGKGACENFGEDLAAAGEFAGAIWIDVQAPLDTIQVPWVSFNAYGNYLPVVMQ